MMRTNTLARITASAHRTPVDSIVATTSDVIALCSSGCSACNLRGLCPPCCGLTRAEMDVADQLVFHRLQVRRGEFLYRNGDPFTSLYAARSGFFKSVVLRRNTCCQVLGFSMTGEILGMEGIGPAQHTCNTIALEDSNVCAIPFAELQGVAREIPSLQRQLDKAIGLDIVRRNGEMLVLGSMNAHERLAMFLIDISQRLAARGYSPSEFNLRMTRKDIGGYLGQNLETVSRIFSTFQRRGVINIDQKFVRILDRAGLERLTGRGCC